MVEFLMKTKENRDPGCYKLSQSFWAASQEASRCPNSDFWLPNSGLLPPIKLFIWKWQFSALRMVPPFMGSKQPLRASTAGGLEVSKTLGFYQGRGFDPSKTRRKTQIPADSGRIPYKNKGKQRSRLPKALAELLGGQPGSFQMPKFRFLASEFWTIAAY